MKLFIWLLLFSFQVSAIAVAQNVTLSVKDARLEDVLRAVSRQSGYSTAMKREDIAIAKPVTITLKSASIETTLQAIFNDQPLTYKIDGPVITVFKKEIVKPASKSEPAIDARRADVTGRIITTKGDPLPGATVMVKGTRQGAVSRQDGSFTVPGSPLNGTLIITMIGYGSREISFRNGTVSDIVLSEVDQTLKEIVVAYGTVKEKYSTTDAQSISGDQIKNQPISNPLIGLQGRIPGLFIKQTSGLNTGAVNVLIQGKNSLNNGNQPFYVIDGVPVAPNDPVAGLPSVSGSIGPSGQMSNLNYLNPNEIESITVLKDADATAIYGSRAANGAILITTKKGKPGQTKVDVNMQAGWGKLGRRIKLLNTQEYIALRKENYANANMDIPENEFDISGVWGSSRNVDWQKELLGGTAHFQNVQASVSGGTEKTQFLVGSSYVRETPVYHGDFSNIKSSVNFNINHSSNKNKFRIFLSGSYLDGNNTLPAEDITEQALTLAPNAPDLYNPDGSTNWGAVPPLRPYQAYNSQPAAILTKRYNNKTENLVANSSLSYEIIPGLSIKSTFGYNNLQTNEIRTNPFSGISPQNKIVNGTKPSAIFSDKTIKSWIIEPQATFSRTFNFGTLDALLGSTFQSTDNRGLGLRGDQYSNDVQLEDFNSAGVKTTTGSYITNYRYTAVFGRLNYRLKDKYIVNLTARRDGSSRFGTENRYHSFYSVGGAWLFSEESLMKNALPFMNYGKLRASYGTTGNDQIPNYSFYTLYNTSSYDVPYLGVTSLSPGGLPNPYLEWEETRKLNLGIDFGFFDSRIMLTTNYFRNRSSNQLLRENLSIVTGFASIDRNLPAIVQNTGWEFSLQYNPIRGTGFNWSGSFNITVPKNKLVRYDGLEKSNDNGRFIVGQSISITKAFKYAGVNPQTGLYQFYNLKGELTSTPSDPVDKFAIINQDPIWYGGFVNNFSYKHFALDVVFTFNKQNGPNFLYSNFPGLSYNVNSPRYVLDYWKKPGDVALLQKVTADITDTYEPWNAVTSSDASFSKIAYARLQNVTLSYNLESSIANRIKASAARIYIQGQNLFTITGYKNSDPEVQSQNTLGLLRMFTAGVQVTF